jgi:magnesium chelatase accessory protein
MNRLAMELPRASGPMCWLDDGKTWPHREASQFVHAAGIRWHVQRFGEASRQNVVLLHGTGAATHSWRSLAPLIAQTHGVLAIDLPGHGFTEMPRDPTALSLPGVSQHIAALLEAMRIDAKLIVGHSAGAAVAAWMCLDGLVTPKRIVGINAALLPLPGFAGQVFSPLAKVLWAAGAIPALFAWGAQNPLLTNKLLDSTGSSIDPAGRALYARLLRSPTHVGAALGMMANWDLNQLEARLPKLKMPLLQIVGEQDKTVSPADAQRVAVLVPEAAVTRLPSLGHLAHEEQAQRVADAMRVGKRYF